MKSSYVRTSEKEKNIMAEKKNEMATTNTTTALKKETENQKKEYNKLVGSLMREYNKVMKVQG